MSKSSAQGFGVDGLAGLSDRQFADTFYPSLEGAFPVRPRCLCRACNVEVFAAGDLPTETYWRN